MFTRTKSRRTVASILLFTLTALLLSACGGSQPSSTPTPASSGSAPSSQPAADKVVEIEFYHIHSGVQEEAIQLLVDEYHKSQSKVRVTPTFIPGSYEGMLEKLQAQAAARQLPALAQAGFVYTQFMIENMPVAAADTYIQAEKYPLDDFFPSMLSLGQDPKGKVWALPFAVSTPIVYLNVDHFKAAGLDANNPPKTWDEMRQVAKQLTSGDQYGVWFDYDITGNWMFQAMVETAGGKMISDDAKSVRFDEEPGLQSLQYWVDLITVDQSMPHLKRDQATKAFLEGNISMFITTTAGLATYTRNAKFELKTVLFPTVGNNPRRVPAGGNNIFIMKTDDVKQQAAWDFVKFSTSPLGTSIVAQGMGYMAARKSAVEKPELMGDFLAQNQNAKTTYEQIADMVPWYNFPGRAGTRIYKLVQDNMTAAFLLEKSPAQALKDAAAEANALLR